MSFPILLSVQASKWFMKSLRKVKISLETGGDLTIVIQKKQGAPSAKSKMEEVFGNCEIVKKIRDTISLEV